MAAYKRKKSSRRSKVMLQNETVLLNHTSQSDSFGENWGRNVKS